MMALVVPPWMAIRLGGAEMPLRERAACAALGGAGLIIAALTTYEAIVAAG